MQTLAYILSIASNILLIVGLVISASAIISAISMLARATKRVTNSKATEADALFLVSSTPGFSKIPLFNYADSIGIGIYTSLALEQVGALDDMQRYTENNIKLYPSLPLSFLAAARYSALAGDKQKALDFVTTAKSLEINKTPEGTLPQLEISAVKELAENHKARPGSTNSVAEIKNKLRKKPLELILTKSVLIFFIGVMIGFLGIISRIIINTIR